MLKAIKKLTKEISFIGEKLYLHMYCMYVKASPKRLRD